MARATSGRAVSRFRYSKIRSSSPAPTGTFRQTSSGNSRNAPISETSTAFPNPSARSKLPELSPTVGKRRLSTMSHAAIYPVKSSMGVNPITRTAAERPKERISDCKGNSGCCSPTRIILAAGVTRSRRRKARNDSAIRLYGFRNPKMPISGVDSSSPRRYRQALRLTCARSRRGRIRARAGS